MHEQLAAAKIFDLDGENSGREGNKKGETFCDISERLMDRCQTYL